MFQDRILGNIFLDLQQADIKLERMLELFEATPVRQ